MPEEYATKLIPDFDLSRTDQWFQELKNIVSRKKPTHIKKYPDELGGDLFTTGDNSNGYYYLQVDGEIVYFVRYRLVKANGNKFGRQVLVARKASSIEANKVAIHIFYEYLLPRFGALITDTQQTRHGKQFWMYALGEAFEKKMYVYCLDRRGTPNTLDLIADRHVLKSDYSDIIWGQDDAHLRTYAVISNKPLSVKVT